MGACSLVFRSCHLLLKVEAWSVGLGPKLLSYRAAPGKGGFLKGKLWGPFSSPENVEENKKSLTDKKNQEKKKSERSGGEVVAWRWGLVMVFVGVVDVGGD